jgi:hypothetical protein
LSRKPQEKTVRPKRSEGALHQGIERERPTPEPRSFRAKASSSPAWMSNNNSADVEREQHGGLRIFFVFSFFENIDKISKADSLPFKRNEKIPNDDNAAVRNR